MFSEKFFENANSAVTAQGVENALKQSLMKYSPKNLDGTAQELMKISGLHADNFDIMASVEKLIRERLNDVSIDDNSNKNEKTIASIQSEATAPLHKAIGFDYLYRTMKELFGKERAVELSGLIYDYSLGLSDSSNILRPYCYAVDASKIVINGRDFGQLQSSPTKHVSSYVAALTESIHQLSSHLAGATAIGTFFFDITHILTYRDNRCSERDLLQLFQQFVHSVNHLSRNGVETPFTNLSIFDKKKLKHIISSDFFWYFPRPGAAFNMTVDEWYDAMVDKVYELQELFLSFFDKGDPANGGMPYRFPVVTLNLSKDLEGNILDQDSLADFLTYDIHRYNIFVSEGDKVASCCRLLTDSEMLGLASQSNSFGAGAVASLGSHRVVTINFNRIALECDTEEDFMKLLNKRIEQARDVLVAHKKLILVLADKGLHPFITNGWINMRRMFSTFGVLGICECQETMERRFGAKQDYIEKVLKRLSAAVEHYSHADEGHIYNIEQIPGESFAVRLATADKIIFGEENVPHELYSNQFVPLWEDATIWEKLSTDGRYNKMLTGGGIVHATVGEKTKPAQSRKIIEFAAKAGCEHFALNDIYSKCENGHTSLGDNDKCPECGGQVIDKLTRVVGFFTPVSSWNKVRREWEFPRRTKVQLNDD